MKIRTLFLTFVLIPTMSMANECEGWNTLPVFRDAPFTAAERVLECIQLGADPDQVDGRGWRAIDQAITFLDYPAVAVLIDSGADLQSLSPLGETPLHAIVTQRGSAPLVAYMLAHGADLEARDQFGNTPLHSAARHGEASAIQVLLSHGANPSVKNNIDLVPADVAEGNEKIAGTEVLQVLQALRNDPI